MNRKNNFKTFVALLTIIGICPLVMAWGTFGHEHINRSAVFALPGSLQIFFYNHIDFITQEATVPDLRKYAINDKQEPPRHFFDLENYGSLDSIPQTMEEARKKHDDKFLKDNGILLWYVPELMEKLTKAFREKKKTEILFLAADLAHYIGDAHMPLHCSANYDGQLTNQKGIHSLWESRLPEMFGNNYNIHAPEAVVINDVKKEIWQIILNSNKSADTVLSIDLALRKAREENKILKTDADGKPMKGKYNGVLFTDDYANAFHANLKGMVERRMRMAIAATANFWYTAWVNAGRPDLTNLDSPSLTERNQKYLMEDLKLWKTGKLFGVESEKEF